MSGYELSRMWFDWCFENPEKVTPNHSAIYFFAIEHCNRLGWKEKFGFPTQMAMDAVGIKKHQTYIRYFEDLCEWGFFKLIQKSQNQYSSNIICIQSAMPKNGKALDKAIINHAAKQTETIGQSTGQSNSSIDKPYNHKQDNHKPQTNTPPSLSEFLDYCKTITQFNFAEYEYSLKSKYQQWLDNGWKDGHDKKIKNWKTKVQNTYPFLPKTQPQKQASKYIPTERDNW